MTSSSFRAASVLRLACCALAFTSFYCSGSDRGALSGAGGTASAGSSGAGGAGAGGGNAGTDGSSAGTSGGAGTDGGGAGIDAAGAGAAGGDVGVAGASGGAAAGGTGGTAPISGTAGSSAPNSFKNYEVSGSFPTAPVALVQKPGQLKYTKIVVQDQFLAESCAIGDYNGDGLPDVSSGRIWYEGTQDPATTFKTQHTFRDGHGELPRTGVAIELNTGVSDDYADYPWDMDGDGDADIINIAQPDIPEANPPTSLITGPAYNAAGTPNKIGTVQVHATAYWYENPGKAGQAGDPNWTMHLMHADVREEHHVLVDMNGDGYPEIVGACRDCVGASQTKGYYQGDPKNPTAVWTYHPVTAHFTFPFGGLGWMHGLGTGDVNGDGRPDFLDRSGAYLQQPDGTWNLTVCTGRNTPAGCGFIQEKTPLLLSGFYDGLPDGSGNKGPSHIFAVDMDRDGCSDVVAADWAHGVGLFWYQQQKVAGACNYAFKKYQFMGNSMNNVPADVAKWGAGFTEPHALQVSDMDGDGRLDVIAGKARLSCPYNCDDPDPRGAPYVYVFKNVATTNPNTGAPITLQPVRVDGDPTALEGTPEAGIGVGHQIAIGHANTDGIMDICVASKVGLAVFLGH